MNLRHVGSCALVCAALALSACEDGRKAPAKVNMTVVNVAPGFAGLTFQRERRDLQYQPANLSFKGLQEYTFDADTYDFFVFERSLIETYTPRDWTFVAELQAERGYLVALTEVAGDVRPIVIEYQDAPAADAQIVGLHAAEGMPAMDLYLERPGVGIAGATPRGTFNAQGQIAPRAVPSGEYELTLTAAGSPATVLFTSTTISLPAGATSTFVVASEPGFASGTPLSVVLVQPSTMILIDRNAVDSLRVVNGATDRAARDFAIDSQFSPPLFSAMPFADPTAYASVSPTTHTINVTPVGNPGVLELNQVYAGLAGQRTTLLFSGPAGTLTHTTVADDGRRIHNEGKLLFLNAAAQFPAIEFVVTSPGADPSTVQGAATLIAPGTSLGYANFGAGDYDLSLRQPGATTLLAGPTRITLASRGIYGVLAVDGPDTATAGLAFFDDFP
jgi:hypothetical protein